ncbi:MAG: PAS domain S-box protein, partial [Candidatus Fermentibacteraceae bacterium]|nr:PAS domain S-box protein [Candidatus Fermentibacteraceae bacterium]
MSDARKSHRKSAPEATEAQIAAVMDQLRLSRSKLSTVLRLTEDVVIVLDRQGTVLDISSHAEDVLDVRVDEIIGKARWEDFVPDDEKERLTGYFNGRASGTGNPPSTYTLRVLVPGGQRFMRANVDFIPGTEERVVILKDLSEVVKEQRRTAESEERYRTVIENTMDGILICTKDRILFVNTSFCSMTELSREEIYTLTPMRLFHEADRTRLEALFQPGGLDERSTQVLETGLRKKQGILPAELSATPMIYRNTEAVLISIRDLTQRKETERQLKEQHKLLQAIVDNSPVGVSVHDRFGTLLLANASWRAIWGKSMEDLKEKMVPRKELRMDRRDSYLGNCIKDVEKVYREGGELFVPILRITNPAPGGAEFISHHFYALMDDDGNVDKVVILTLDLTESLRTEDELKETRDQYRELFSNIPVAVYRTTLESGGRIVSANPEMIRMFRGQGNTDLKDITVKDLYVDSSRRKELMQSLLDDEEVQGFEAELRRVDGSTFLGSISARKVAGREGEPDYIEGIIRDITDQRRMEEELLNIEHLESIGTLAGGIAHDFNNLLMAIQGSISLAREEKDPSLSDRYLKETEESIQEATVLTRQLLTFARGGVPVKESVDVESCVRDAVQFTIRGSDAEALFDFQDGLENISADREQIAQVLQNMALNSLQAMSGGGRITVSCS